MSTIDYEIRDAEQKLAAARRKLAYAEEGARNAAVPAIQCVDAHLGALARLGAALELAEAEAAVAAFLEVRPLGSFASDPLAEAYNALGRSFGGLRGAIGSIVSRMDRKAIPAHTERGFQLGQLRFEAAKAEGELEAIKARKAAQERQAEDDLLATLERLASRTDPQAVACKPEIDALRAKLTPGAEPEATPLPGGLPTFAAEGDETWAAAVA